MTNSKENTENEKSNLQNEEHLSSKRIHIKSIIYKKFLEWSLSSTIHGYSNIFKSRQIQFKVLWTIFMLSSILGCILLLKGSISRYLDHAVITKIRIVEEEIVDFPTVTICNTNPFTTENASNILSELKFTNLTDLWNMNQLKFRDKKIPYLELLYKASHPDFGDLNRKSLGYSLREILIFCSHDKIDCNYEDFSWHYSFYFGNCFQFNSGKNAQGHHIPFRSTTYSGQEGALWLFFYLPPPIKLNFPLYSTGMKLFINNSSFLPFIFNDGIDIEKGKMTNIGLRRTLTYKSPFPYSDCENLKSNKKELYKYIVEKLKRNYRQKDCMELCFQKKIIKECKCYSLKYPKYGDEDYCHNSTQYGCFVKQYHNLKTIKLSCQSECPLECDSISYDFTISSTTVSQLYYEFLKNDVEKDFFKKEITYEEFQQRVLGIRIFYVQKQYTEIKETPKVSIFDVFSSLGGSLSLCLGMSILSFIDIALIIFEIFILIIFKRKH